MSICELSIEKKMEFFTLYNAFKAAEKTDERAKRSWTFLCFVYKYLGDDMLQYFVKKLFVEEGSETISMMVRARAIVQPHLFEKD